MADCGLRPNPLCDTILTSASLAAGVATDRRSHVLILPDQPFVQRKNVTRIFHLDHVLGLSSRQFASEHKLEIATVKPMLHVVIGGELQLFQLFGTLPVRISSLPWIWLNRPPPVLKTRYAGDANSRR